MCEGVSKTEGSGSTPKLEGLTQDSQDENFDPTNGGGDSSINIQELLSMLTGQGSALGFNGSSAPE